MTRVAPRIVNSVSCVTRINHEIHFSWQAQYLVSFLSINFFSTKKGLWKGGLAGTVIRREFMMCSLLAAGVLFVSLVLL